MKGGEASFDWGDLALRLAHPVQVAILEAMLWMGQPLAASELFDLFGEPDEYNLSRVSYHVVRLATIGALEKTSSRQVRGAVKTYYFLAPSANGDGAHV